MPGGSVLSETLTPDHLLEVANLTVEHPLFEQAPGPASGVGNSIT